MTTTLPGAPSMPSLSSADLRRRRLAVMKRRATWLLVAVTAVFLAVTIFGGDGAWVGYVQATAEAAMIGGLADWFAVTALFRHPLGLPIPHTAIVAERKDQVAATLGEFIQDSFLTPATVLSRVRAARVTDRVAEWASDPVHAQRVAAEALGGAVKAADLLRDDDVHHALEKLLKERVEDVPVAPLAGRALEFLMRDGRHHQALDGMLRELDRYLDEHREELRVRLSAKSPWWLPRAAEDGIFERLIEGGRTIVHEMLEDPDHALRHRFDGRLVQLADDLQHSPEFLEKGEKLKHELLAQPQVGRLVTSMWSDAKEQLRLQSVDPTSELHTRLTTIVMGAASRLREDPELAAKAEESIETAVTYIVERFHGEIGRLVGDTIEKWDAEETSDRLELLLGPDLQYIRINGTVVGAAAGLVLYSIAQLLGGH